MSRILSRKAPLASRNSTRLARVLRQCALAGSIALLLPQLASRSSLAADSTWNTDADGSWATDANWTAGAPGAVSGNTSTDTAVFGPINTAARVITVDTGRNIFGINFAGNSNAYTLSGGSLLITHNGLIQTSGGGTAHTDTINSPITLAGNVTFATNSTTAARALAFGALATVTGSSTQNSVITLDGIGTSTSNAIAGIISNGTGFTTGLSKTGVGTWVLSGANSFTGGTTISNGTLSISTTANLGANSSPVLIDGGTLALTASITGTTYAHATTIGNNSGTIKVTTGTGAAQLTFNNANTLLGSGTLTVVANGSLVDGAGFQGNVALNSAQTFSGNVSLQSGGQLEVNNNSALATSSSITIGTGELIADTGITIGNSINVNGGQLTFNNGNLGVFAGNITVGSSGATIRLADFFSNTPTARSGTISGNISGTGGLTLTNHAGTLTLSGTSSYTGNTNLGTSAMLLDVIRSNQTYAGVISGAGGKFTKAGPGTFTLTNTNTYTGLTTIQGGILQVGDGATGALSSSTALTFVDTGAFRYQGPAGGATQALSTTTFSFGAGAIESVYGSSGNASLTLSNVAARTAGATGNFITTGGSNGTTNKIVFTQVAGATPTVGALLDKAYYFNGADFAAYDSGGFVRALSYGSDTSAAAVNTITAANHTKLTATPANQNSVSLLTLNLAGSGVSWTNNASQTLTLSGGGLIKSGGGSVATIGGGTGLTTGGATEFVIRTDTASDLLTISIPITNTSTAGLTKTGAGTLTLAGPANAYTGTTTVNEGTLTLSGTSTGGGDWTLRNTGTLNINGAVTNGGVLNVTPQSGGVAVANINAAFTLANAKKWLIGNVAGGVGVGNVAANISGGNQALDVGENGVGVFNVNAGTVTPGAFVVAGVNGGSAGIWNINGGAVTTAGNNGGTLGINNGAFGVMNIASGSYSSTDATASGQSGIYVGENSGGIGLLNIWGTGAGNFGGATTSKGLTIARNSGSSGVVNLGAVAGGGTGTTGGGTISATSVQGAGTGIFNFHGGTLKSGTTTSNASPTFMTGLSGGAYVYSEGGVIDNNGQSITIGQALLAPGGSGVMSLTLGGSTTGFTPGATPLVRLVGGGGSGASAISQVDASGNLSLILTNPGTGYTSAPVVTFLGLTGAGIPTATATLGANTSGGLTFQGSGTTTLTGSNTYTGGTTITNGTLALGASNVLADGGAINVSGGALSLGANSDSVGAFTLNSGSISSTTGTLTASAFDLRSGTVSAKLAGPALAKTTSGTVTFSGASYAGPASINAGTLGFSGATSTLGSLAAADAASSALNLKVVIPSPAAAVLSAGSVTLGATASNSSTVLVDFANLANPTAAPITIAGGLTLNGSVTLGGINPSGLTNTNGAPFTLITAGSISGAFANPVITLGARSTGAIGYTPTAVTLDVSTDSITWSGANGSTWTTGTTGSVGAAPSWATVNGHAATDYWAGDIVKLGDTYDSGSGDTAVTNASVSISGGNVSPASVSFANSSVAYTVASADGSAIAGTAALTKSGTGAVTISSKNSYTGGTIVNGGALTFSNDNAFGSGGFTVNGGILTLSGMNTYTGATLVNAGGTLNIQSNGALGSSAATVANGGALQLQNGIITGTNPLTLNGGGLAAAPAGALENLSGSNTYAGLLTLGSNATVQSDSGTLTLSNAGTITGAGFTLTLAGAGNGSVSSLIGTGAGGVIKNDAGTWTLTGANTYIGATTINGGTLSVGTNTNLGSATVGQAPVTLNGGTITTTAGITNTHAFTIGANGGTINVPTNAQYFFNTANTLLGTGQLTVTGNGALAAGFGNLRLAQVNSYSGNMVLQSGGVLEYGVSGAVGAGATFTLGNQGEVSLSAGSALSLPNAVTVNGGTNSVLSFGNGTLGNYTGAITLNANLTVALRDWFNYATVRSGTISGSISGLGGLTVNSGSGANGTLTLSGTNSYAGNTTVTSSILAVTKAAALPGYSTPGRVGIGAGATLRVNAGGTNEFAGTDLDAIAAGVSFASGSTFAIDTTNATAPVVASANLTAAGLGLIKLGAGVLSLNGAHTYTGPTTISAGTLGLAGSINSGTSGGVVVGNTAGSKAILNIASGSTLSANNLALGTNATGPGAVYQTGGSVTLNQAAGTGNLPLGAVAGGYGYYSLSGGTLAVNEVGVGGLFNGSTGVMDITNGGTLNDVGWLTIGRGGTTSSGILTVNGGTVNLAGTVANSKLALNWAGATGAQSVVNISNGGAITGPAAGTSYVLDLASSGNNAGTLGMVNLGNAGTLQIAGVTASNANPSAVLNFNGGTLKATVSNANYLTSANVDGVYVYSGGAQIDDNGAAITIATPLLAPTGNGITAVGLLVSGNGYIGAPMVQITGGGGKWASAIANIDANGNLTGITITNPGVDYTAAPTFTLLGGGGSGTVSGAATLVPNATGVLTKTGLGTLTLSGASTYASTTISAGTLAVGADSALGSGVVTLNGGTLAASGSRTLTNSVQVNAVSGNGLNTGSDLTLNGSLTGQGVVTKTGDASLFLGGDNGGFRGSLMLVGGFTHITAYTAGSPDAEWDIGPGATLAGDAPGSGIIALGALLGSGILGNNTGVGSPTLLIGGKNTSTTFSGSIKDDVLDFPSDPLNVTKTGSGRLTLAGASTYTGPTIVNGGTLEIKGSLAGTVEVRAAGGSVLLGANDAINPGADLTLAGGSLATGGFSLGSLAAPGLDALNLSATSALDFGAGSGSQLFFAAVGTHTLGTHLDITDWSGTPLQLGGAGDDRLIFSGADLAAFTSRYAQLDVSFNGIPGYSALALPDQQHFEIVAVPEPSSTALWAAASMVLLTRWRAWRRLSAKK